MRKKLCSYANTGTVEVHSAGRGSGATFVVRLPTRAVQIDASSEERVEGVSRADKPDSEVGGEGALHFPPVRLDGLRVLVVDDEADARRVLVKVLEQVGAVVAAAESAAEALQLLPKFHPEVLVSDLGMPHEDGFDLIRQVRGSGYHAKDLPAVALTAYVNKVDQRKALLAGFQVHVAKPVDPHDLTAVIAGLVGRTN